MIAFKVMFPLCLCRQVKLFLPEGVKIFFSFGIAFFLKLPDRCRVMLKKFPHQNMQRMAQILSFVK